MRDRMRVHSPKTEHLEGGGDRWVPLFPELRPILAKSVTERSEPPIAEPGGSKGEVVPKSITNPVSFDKLCHVTLVPAFTQKGALALGLAILATAAAESDARLTSTVQGVGTDPHVVLSLHMLSGWGAEHTLWWRPCRFSWATP